MKAILIINFLLVTLAALVPNEFLLMHSYLFYALQVATLLPDIVRRVAFVKDLFTPSIFVLVYHLTSLGFGSYLLPRGYGYYKGLETGVNVVQTYNVIVPYLLLTNIALYVIGILTLRRLRGCGFSSGGGEGGSSAGKMLWHMSNILWPGVFLVLSIWDPYSSFSFLFAVCVIHFSALARSGANYRYLVYSIYVFVYVTLNHDNKREIVMVLLLCLFLEAFYSRRRFRLSLATLGGAGVACFVILVLILAASLWRGYGNYDVRSFGGAVSRIPDYARSEEFVHGLTDNFELNFSYGSAVVALDMILTGEIDYQYGKTLAKVLFLPIPRELFPYKPESFMQLFTKKWDPDFWAIDGSLPVMFPVDAFSNFHFLGLIPYILIWTMIDHCFILIHGAATAHIVRLSCIFLSMSVLPLARGSGIEQYVLYWLLALPIFVVSSFFLARRSRGSGG